MEAFAYEPTRARPPAAREECPKPGKLAATLHAASASASTSSKPVLRTDGAGEPGAIRSMSGATALRICSDQVVVDLRSALKELVENALDAGATKIEVKLREHGAESLEVSDNGGGIAKDNLAGVAQRHHTSKLSSFDDLGKLRSFGFRGEALSSLALSLIHI